MNRTQTAIILTALMISGTAFADLNKGLVAHWNFDDCSANDVSGNQHNGNKNGTQCVQGLTGKALDFNGTSDYVEIPSDQNLSNFTDITLSVWAYRKGESNDTQGIVTKWYQYAPNSASEINQDTYALILDNGFLVGGTNNYVFSNLVSKNKAPLNKWFHIVFTHSNVNGGKLYVNGILKGSVNIGGVIVPSSNPIILGADNNFGTIWRFFQGTIDDARLYNRILSKAEIRQLYRINQQIAGSSEGYTSLNVTCSNKTTGKEITFISTNTTTSSWNCEQKGLVVNPGDQVNTILSGKAHQ
ncbi:LamG domain-containing protein [Methylovulum psychrotolerans]|nr:LamG domain-containing protein [Methylovulum psychrotolerans]